MIKIRKFNAKNIGNMFIQKTYVVRIRKMAQQFYIIQVRVVTDYYIRHRQQNAQYCYI